MADGQSQGRAGIGPGFWLVQLLIVVALVIAAFLIGKSMAGGDGGSHKPPEPPDDRAIIGEAGKLLDDAVKAGQNAEWTPAHEAAFRRLTSQVSTKQRFELNLRLVNLVNSRKLHHSVDPAGDTPGTPPGGCDLCSCLKCDQQKADTAPTRKAAAPAAKGEKAQ